MMEAQQKVYTQSEAPLLRTQKKPKRILRIIAGLLLMLFYFTLSSFALVLYGPFENMRRAVVGAVLTSRHPQYIEPFYSAETLNKYRPISMETMSEGSMHAGNFSQVHDDGIDVIPITTTKYSGSLLVIKDPKRVHVGVTKELGSVGETVSSMVKRENAIAGINAGGFYDVKGKGTGGMPLGVTLSRGKYIGGYQGVAQPMIGLTKEGALVVGKYKYEDLQKLGVQDAVSFGPQLVRDGQPFLKAEDDSWGIAPRSAIGQRSDGAILLLALSGRGKNGIGASLIDCEEVMLENGATVAANLDGGYSTELYYNNGFLVEPSNPLGERYVATSFIVDGVKK